jgi:hypothetical protein
LPDDQYRIEPLLVATEPQEFTQTRGDLRMTVVSFSAEAMQLADVIAHLEGESGINFAIDIAGHADIKVDGQWQNRPLAEVLDQLAEDYNFGWTIHHNVVILHEEESRGDPRHLMVKVYPVRDLIASRQALQRQLTNPWTQVPAHRIQSGMSGMGCGFSSKYGAMSGWLGFPYQQYDPNQPDFGDLIHTLTTSIRPESWEKLGGNGSGMAAK